MTEEKEPICVRYASLTPKGRRLIQALNKMFAELKEDVQSSTEVIE